MDRGTLGGERSACSAPEGHLSACSVRSTDNAPLARMEDGMPVAYSSEFIYTRILGSLGNNGTGVEQWGVGFKIPKAGTVSPADLSAYLAAIEAPVKTFHGTVGLTIGNTCFLKQLTAAHVGKDGKYVGGGAQSTTVHDVTPPLAGGAGTQNAFSTAMVISLRTQFARGRASNGRIYYPALGNSIDPVTGQWSQSYAQSWADAAKTLLDAINAAAAANLDTTNHVSVMSNVGSGQLSPVTHVRVGRKPDRQERRERDIAEDYVTVALASTATLVAAQAEKPFGI